MLSSETMLVGPDLPQLQSVLWSRRVPEVTEAEAFDLYETNRAWIEPSRMTPHERAFFEALVERFGRGAAL